MDSSDFIRTFVCIEIPGEVRNQIEALQHRLSQIEADVSWVRATNIHLTLRFLGNVPVSRMGTLCSAVKKAVQGQRVCPVEITGTGCFPSPRSPRVLWVGIASPTGALNNLQAAVESGLGTAGFENEARPFSPHLTVGRLKSQRNARRLVEALMEKGFEAITFQANEVVVMRSDLRPTGALYTRQAVIPLLRPEA